MIFCTIAARTPDWDGYLVNCALAARIKRTGKLVVGTPGGATHDDLVVEPSDIISHRSHGMARSPAPPWTPPCAATASTR